MLIERNIMGIQNTLRALGDPVRREILEMLKGGRLSAGEITEHFDISAPAISRHLSVLKDADLIRDTRQGKFIYYELNTSVLEEILIFITQLGFHSVQKCFRQHSISPYFDIKSIIPRRKILFYFKL